MNFDDPTLSYLRDKSFVNIVTQLTKFNDKHVKYVSHFVLQINFIPKLMWGKKIPDISPPYGLMVTSYPNNL